MPDEALKAAAPWMPLTYSIADQDFERTKSIGILNVSLQLLKALTSRLEFSGVTVLCNSPLARRLQVPGTVKVRIEDRPLRGKLARIWWDQWEVYQAARRTGNPWLLLPKGFASFIRRPPVRMVAFIHDTVHDHYRRHFPGAVPFLESRYFEACFRASLRNSSLVLTLSEFSQGELERLAREQGIHPPPICPVGVGFDVSEEPWATREDSILVLTSRWPHKLSSLCVDYLTRWQQQTRYPGSIHWVGALPETCEFPSFGNWKRHLRLAEPEYRQLMRTARAVVYFSSYEGFGMPPVEAVLAGASPVYSEIPVTREVMKGAGCPFQNDSYSSFSSAMGKALELQPGRLAEWRAALGERFSWENVGGLVAEALLERMREGGGGGCRRRD